MTQSRTRRSTLAGGFAAAALALASLAIATPASADTYVAPTLSATDGNIATPEQITCPGEGETPGVTMNFDVQTGSVAPVNFTWGIVGSTTTNTLTEANRLYEARGDFLPTDATSYTISIVVSDGVGPDVTATQEITCEEVPPPTPSIVQVRAEAYCIDNTTPAGEVRVAVDFPEGAAPADLGVVYGDQQSLGGIIEVTASGEYSFQGALPVGVTEFTVVLDGFAAGEGSVNVVACETNTNPGGGDNGGDNGGTTNPGTQPGTSNPGTTTPDTNTSTDYVVPGGKTDGFGLTSAASNGGLSQTQVLLLGGSASGILLILIYFAAKARRGSMRAGR